MTTHELAELFIGSVRTYVARELEAARVTMRAEVRAELVAELKTIPAGPQGEPGPVGEPGPEGTPGPTGEPGKDGREGKDGRDGRDGKDGADGADGLGPAEVEDVVTKALEARLTHAVEAAVTKAMAAHAVPTYKNVWQPSTRYAPGHMVTFGGSLWHCNVATEQKPGTGEDWTLAVKKGRDASRAEPVPRGAERRP